MRYILEFQEEKVVMEIRKCQKNSIRINMSKKQSSEKKLIKKIEKTKKKKKTLKLEIAIIDLLKISGKFEKSVRGKFEKSVTGIGKMLRRLEIGVLSYPLADNESKLLEEIINP